MVDVRLRPDRSSMGAYVKAKSENKGIQQLLSDAGVQYISKIELGNIFMEYEDWLDRYRRFFQFIGDQLVEPLMDLEDPLCLMCAEKKVENWQKFAKHMEEYIRDRTVKKYGIENSGGFDLISIT